MTLEQMLSATAEHVAEAKAAGVPARDANRAMVRSNAARLTAKQRAEVRSLQEDSGYSRAEAVAWVREMGGL